MIPRDRTKLLQLAESALPLWGLALDSRVQLINISENATFLIAAPDGAKKFCGCIVLIIMGVR